MLLGGSCATTGSPHHPKHHRRAPWVPQAFLPNPPLAPYIFMHLCGLTCPQAGAPQLLVLALGLFTVSISIATCDTYIRQLFLLGSRAGCPTACWTAPPGDLLRHGGTNPGCSGIGLTGSAPGLLIPCPPASLQTTNPKSFLAHSTQLLKYFLNPSRPLPHGH